MNREPKRMHELLAAARNDLLALPTASLERPRVTRERAVQLTTTLRQEVEPLLPRFAEVLAPDALAARTADYQSLEERALIYYAADLAIDAAGPSAMRAQRADLAAKVHEHDALLSEWAAPLFRKHAAAAAELTAILRGRGVRDDADDTLKLVSLFRRHWPAVQGQTPVTEAYLTEAEADATTLVQLLDQLEGAANTPRDLRRRAFTYWSRPYQEIYHLGRYLLRFDPEAAERLPGLTPERSSRSKPSSPPPPAPDPEPPVDSTSTPA